MEPACILTSRPDSFSQLPPFTTWTIDVPAALNPVIQLAAVSNVHVFFHAYASKSLACGPDPVPENPIREAIPGYPLSGFNMAQEGLAALSSSCAR